MKFTPRHTPLEGRKGASYVERVKKSRVKKSEANKTKARQRKLRKKK